MFDSVTLPSVHCIQYDNHGGKVPYRIATSPSQTHTQLPVCFTRLMLSVVILFRHASISTSVGTEPSRNTASSTFMSQRRAKWEMCTEAFKCVIFRSQPPKGTTLDLQLFPSYL